MGKILIPLAEGFEEIEAVTNIDVLRRAGLEVVTAGIGGREIMGDHAIKVEADEKIENIDSADISAVVLPGGMPGAANLRDSEELLEIIRDVNNRGDLCAAICAAPIVLEAAGILEGKKATSYPGFDEEMQSADYQEKKLVIDGNIITSRGPGLALEFALNIVEYLVDSDKSEQLKNAMLFQG
ncbi:DJ-1 family glyoxalase III [Halanaerobium hydrogeniformans]|uniref:DJ-1 family protein n=1 Tax=Halanaerobium hydrogeniformans TaxID=656519 RepID=E4RN01_HALHG|nr:DJ-1 family glyoxalase III [Halanaerobium hydrogeniformans]ADQ14218.1 DJ-1 family protein [Halanaerobium hydrogeniformans]